MEGKKLNNELLVDWKKRKSECVPESVCTALVAIYGTCTALDHFMLRNQNRLGLIILLFP